jgi:hypothetical protein
MHDDTPDRPGPPIPKVLHSAYHEGPFEACDACGKNLQTEVEAYQLQKSFRGPEVVFEIALCLTCMMEAMSCISRESMQAMRLFQAERYRPSESLDACHFCRKELGPEDDHEIAAVCADRFLARPPVVLCGTCSEEMQEKLSRKTRDGWGDFISENVPGVPESMEPDKVPISF